MANTKTGLSYYNIDTDRYQDIRIKRLKKTFGCQGLAVYDYILCEIYRVRGCFLEWDENTAFDVAEYFGLKETVVREIVQYCASVGLYNKELLCRGIITSRSIQQRYIDICNRAKRKTPAIPEEYKLTEELPKTTEELPKTTEELPKTTEELPKTTEELRNNSGSLPQSKVKYSKVEESKEKELPSPSIVSPTLTGERGGRDIISLLSGESISRDDILEACRLTNDGTPGYATDFIASWAAYDATTKTRYPFGKLLEYLQQLEKQGRIKAPSEEEFTVRRWLRNNLTTSDSEKILSLLTTPERFNDCYKLLGEVKKGRINLPAQFLLKRLQV